MSLAGLLSEVDLESWIADGLYADFTAVDAVVDATHRYHDIFYDKQD